MSMNFNICKPNLNIQFIPTSSFQPVAPQFVKDEEFFLSERNCPGDGYAWFWTPTNQEGQKAKYIKISNKSANNQFIQQFSKQNSLKYSPKCPFSFDFL